MYLSTRELGLVAVLRSAVYLHGGQNLPVVTYVRAATIY